MVKWYTVKLEIWDTDLDDVTSKNVKLLEHEFEDVVTLVEKYQYKQMDIKND